MLPNATKGRSALLALLWAALGASSCGDLDIRDGMTTGYQTCQSRDRQFHFQVLVPPWKFNKEYRCDSWSGDVCIGIWYPTGRFVWVVSDVPFVNYDSEIVTSLDVSYETGSTSELVMQLVSDEQVGTPGSDATFQGDPTSYPREVTASQDGGLSGHELLWRQNRTFDGTTFNWFRRDVFLLGQAGRVYHLKFFSIDSLDRPEFDQLISTFREGPAEDEGVGCPCRDEHDPSNPGQQC